MMVGYLKKNTYEDTCAFNQYRVNRTESTIPSEKKDDIKQKFARHRVYGSEGQRCLRDRKSI